MSSKKELIYILRKTKKAHYIGLLIDPALVNLMEGRIMRREDLPFGQEVIESYIKRGFFKTHEAISVTNSFWRRRYRCERCFNEEQRKFIHFYCAKCEQTCTYCRHCIVMGRISSCTQLLTWGRSFFRALKKHQFNWAGTLTKLQQQASLELASSIMNKRSHLLHAVCGAGKSEILFQPIYRALQKGQRICIATPRTDVVLELAPRLQQVFPTTVIHALYGGAQNQHGYAQLVIATTHQLYRFVDAFDVMIVDEADAFPYRFDEVLQKAVYKAKKKDAPVAFVTATPDAKLLQICEGYSFISKRYHDYPLPIPRFQPLWGYKQHLKKGKLPKPLQHWTEQQIIAKKPFLIFFPTIEMLEQAHSLFQQLDTNILAVHAEDPTRKEKVQQLRNEEILGLLTTTILERGITIANLQVAVVGAESPIFTADALIQIAGRVGRSELYPTGDVVFFYHGISLEMDLAKREILRLNEVSNE
ncbi:DEAD/DEAH box helicase [Metasolibacillus sp. FSL K6-0083]|uniref:DEAD/DEAH box helicase n=1 Tax=Metasolibacillus sp. FSL K6-0083 TaxID=2921416 RepID=UPI00315A63D4